MIPFRFGIARFMIVTAGVAAGLTTMRQSIPVGCLVLAATLLVAFREVLLACLQALWIPIAKLVIRLHQRKIGAVGVLCLTFLIAAAPYFLFFDPVDYRPWRRHVAREPLSIYRLFSDDIPYVSSSRNWQRTVANLFEPHNTHVVPAWRVVTWALVRTAGTLPRLPSVLAVASYSILIAVMLLTGRLVARESGRAALGLAAMALVGTTSLMLAPAIWYSAGQPLWAGFGILTALWYAQSYRRSGRRLPLALAGIAAAIAGWLWTIGHVAGPVTAVYLWADRRPRCRRAAALPLVASALAAAIAFGLGGRHIDSKITFHGREVSAAINPVQGLLHTCQAIPENLVFANLGLTATTTTAQGVLLCASGLLLLGWIRFGRPGAERSSLDRILAPLQWAGATIVVAAYMVEWTVRGYMDYQFLRTVNLRFFVPWYDAVPQIGAVLFAAGWSNPQPPASAGSDPTITIEYADTSGVSACLFVRCPLDRAQPSAGGLSGKGQRRALAAGRAGDVSDRAAADDAGEHPFDRERPLAEAASARLDQCEQIARRRGWGRDAVRAAFGHMFIPGAVVQDRPELYNQYDAAALLDLPDHGQPFDTQTVRTVLAELYAR